MCQATLSEYPRGSWQCCLLGLSRGIFVEGHREGGTGGRIVACTIQSIRVSLFSQL